VEKCPSFLRAQKNLGLVYVQSNAFDKAIGPAGSAPSTSARPTALTFGLLAHSYNMTEQNVAAEAAYRQAMMLQPDVNDWKLGLAPLPLQAAQVRGGGALCGDMIRRDPARADLWLLQANAFLALKQPLKAAENYELLAARARRTWPPQHAGRHLRQRGRAGAGGGRLPARRRQGSVRRGSRPVPARRRGAGSPRRAGRGRPSRRPREGDLRYKTGAAEQKRVLKLEARLAAAQGGTGDEQAKLLEEIVALDPSTARR